MTKKLFCTRPLAIALSLFLLTLFLCLFTTFSHALPAGIFTAILLLTGTGLFLLDKKKRFLSSSVKKLFPVILILLAALLLSFLVAFHTEHRRQSILSTYDGKTAEAEIAIQSVQTYNSVVVIQGELLRFDGNDCRLSVSASLFGHTLLTIGTLRAGDILCGAFTLTATERGELMDMSEYADGLLLTAEAQGELSLSQEKAAGFSYKLASLRQTLATCLQENLGEKGYGLLNALLLADKSGIEAASKRNFSSLGISHLFAVSGLHLSLLVGFLDWLLQKLGLARRLCYPFLAVVILFYMALTGFAPSLLRSGGMLLLYYLSYFFGRQKDSVTSLLTATTVIVLLSPTSILDLGLLLSFTATLGILLIASPFLKELNQKSLFHAQHQAPSALVLRLVKGLLSSLTVTLAATAGTLPILCLTYGKLFLFSFLSNLLFTPMISLLLIALPFFFLCLPFAPLSSLLRQGVELLAELMEQGAAFGATFSDFNIALDYPFMPFLVLLCLVSVVLLLRFSSRRLLPFLPIVVFLLAAPLAIAITDTALVESESLLYTTDGTNDALILTYEDKGLLVDVSQSSLFRREALEKTGTYSASVTPDTLLLTSVSASHLTHLPRLVESYPISCLILPAGNENAAALTTLAQQAGLSVFLYTPGDTLIWNGITLVTYAGTTKTSVAALDITLDTHTVLYLKENAPDLYDIRFGPMASYRDTVILGASGSPCKSRPLTPLAATAVQGTDTPSIRKTDDYLLLYETYFWSDQ